MNRQLDPNRDGWNVPLYAEKYAVHPQTVRNWIRAGLLEAKRIGFHWRITREADQRFIANCNPE